jgi:hypothetical protein
MKEVETYIQLHTTHDIAVFVCGLNRNKPPKLA